MSTFAATAPASQRAAAPSTSAETSESSYRLPSATTLTNAIKLAIAEDMPIMMDYWTMSLDKTVIIGVREGNEKLLVKNENEYTSPISKIYRSQSEYLVKTENSLYIVSSDIASKRISASLE
jgi:hypothetical protein